MLAGVLNTPLVSQKQKHRCELVTPNAAEKDYTFMRKISTNNFDQDLAK